MSALSSLQTYCKKKRVAPRTPQKSAKKKQKQRQELIVKETQPCPEFYAHYQ